MAKLSHSQRCKYEENGGIGVSMIDERRTFFDYRILTPAIKKEYLEILEFAFSDTARKMGWMEEKVSSHQHFKYCEKRIRIINRFHGHRMMSSRTTSNQSILSMDYGELTTFRNTETVDNHDTYEKLRKLTHEYIETKLGFERKDDGYYNPSYNHSYRLNKTIKSEELNHTLASIIISTVPKYVFPGKPHSLMLSETDGMIQYEHHGRIIEMRIGKGIKKFFKLHSVILSDESIKNASNRLNLKVSDFVLKVVEGKDIDKYYNGDQYDNSFNTGSLGSSCMRGDDATDGNFFEVYKDHAKMIILVNEESDLIIGRAILWHTAKYAGDEVLDDEGLHPGDIVYIMDRIYSDESVYSIFKDWARENGYYRKRYQSYNNEILWKSPMTKDEVELHFEMDINLNQYDYVPYMDTFAWGDNDQVRNEEGFGFYAARSTEGILEGGDNEERYHEDDYDEDEDDDCGW